MIQDNALIPLVIGWLKAWESYKGYVADIGALPGIVVGIEAGILREDDRDVRGESYLNSKTRAEFNLALRQCQAQGWLDMITVPTSAEGRMTPHILTDRLDNRPWPIGWLFKDSQAQRNAIEQQHWAPDFCWWIISYQALQDATVAAEMDDEQLRPLGLLEAAQRVTT